MMATAAPRSTCADAARQNRRSSGVGRDPLAGALQDRSVGSRRVCDTPYPPVPKGGVNA